MTEPHIAPDDRVVFRAFYRPDTVDAASLLERIETYLIERGTSATVFGRRALNDPSLIFDLRKGRRVTRRTVSRVEAYLAREVRA
ncbi:hypothetical protein [Sphingobium tyrosinilyticum]|uniref:Uncharacterized protein n=1 Tax=Sphingobium tyrosinilyticum TaxID=2715436 RepID=A0ABV9EXT8_9SPHN